MQVILVTELPLNLLRLNEPTMHKDTRIDITVNGAASPCNARVHFSVQREWVPIPSAKKRARPDGPSRMQSVGPVGMRMGV